MTQVIASQREINNWARNMKFNLECSERLVFKPFLVIMMQNINVNSFGTNWPQLVTGTPCGSHSSRNN